MEVCRLEATACKQQFNLTTEISLLEITGNFLFETAPLFKVAPHTFENLANSQQSTYVQNLQFLYIYSNKSRTSNFVQKMGSYFN